MERGGKGGNGGKGGRKRKGKEGWKMNKNGSFGEGRRKRGQRKRTQGRKDGKQKEKEEGRDKLNCDRQTLLPHIVTTAVHLFCSTVVSRNTDLFLQNLAWSILKKFAT